MNIEEIKAQRDELRVALGRIGYITETNFENSGEMAEAIDRIHDIAYAALASYTYAS